jgi:hypothetical protein
VACRGPGPCSCVHARVAPPSSGLMPRPYGEREYRAARAYLAATPVVCAWPGCTARATSPDHVPPLIEHDHAPGSGCCVLRPLCLTHNSAAGARVGNRRRRARSRSRSHCYHQPLRHKPIPSGMR